MKITKQRLKKLIQEEIMQEQVSNRIYIVKYDNEGDYRYDTGDVFSSREKAEAFIASQPDDGTKYEIESRQVDDPEALAEITADGIEKSRLARG